MSLKKTTQSHWTVTKSQSPLDAYFWFLPIKSKLHPEPTLGLGSSFFYWIGLGSWSSFMGYKYGQLG